MKEKMPGKDKYKEKVARGKNMTGRRPKDDVTEEGNTDQQKLSYTVQIAKEEVSRKWITRETLQLDIKDVDRKGKGDEVMKNPRDTMEKEIWIWWGNKFGEKKPPQTWVEFKEEVVKNFMSAEQKEMPELLQDVGESMKDWLERVEKVGNKRGRSQKEIKKCMCRGWSNMKMRRLMVKDEVLKRDMEEFKQEVIRMDRETKRDKTTQGKRDSRGSGKSIKCFKCEKEGHIAKNCTEVVK
ncbi:hypothetical protein NERG_00217 [Nematocida ausubeli]|uniref:CCHC-type domain-containing protein n=1 Tax=Nematocida ausubeli (strain ATCC PRA-371 / ERTm2) TaxID=1913371 RepID=H8Z9E6_NEMA1|nr:hypothetical protein NERG_00217 [Nematocida ausubeli]